MPLRFRSVRDLHELVVSELGRLPCDVDLVVGIPRSGLLVGQLIALYLDKPLTDVGGLLEQRLLQPASSDPDVDPATVFDKARKVLVVDDSVGHGTQMRATRRRLAGLAGRYELVFAAAYVTPEGRALVDVALERLPWGHCFGWNVLHHRFLRSCCFDIDGTVVSRPEDGDAQPRVLERAVVPSVEVGWLVSGWPHEHRPALEERLRAQGLPYKHLLVRPDGAVDPVRVKAAAYRSSGAVLYVAAGAAQGGAIAEAAGLPVLALAEQRLLRPSAAARLPMLARRAPASARRRVAHLLRPLTGRALPERPRDLAPSPRDAHA